MKLIGTSTRWFLCSRNKCIIRIQICKRCLLCAICLFYLRNTFIYYYYWEYFCGSFIFLCYKCSAAYILRNINLSLLYTARSSRQNRIIHARVIKLNYSLRIHIMYLCARYDMVATHLCGCCLLLLLKYYVVCSILKTFLISFRRRSVALNVRGVYNDNVPYHIYSL